MTDYRKLSDHKKRLVDIMINQEVEPGCHKNSVSGFEGVEPDFTLDRVHAGEVCAECLMIYYNCLCSHQN